MIVFQNLNCYRQAIYLLLLIGTLFCPSLSTAAIETISISDQGQVYEIPLKGWNFKRRCGSGMCPVKDVEIMAKLAQARDGFTQTISPESFPHADLAETLRKLAKSTQNKQKLNQFDQALTNVAGTAVGTAIRSGMGDPTAAISVVSAAISTTAAAGSAVGSVEALNLGIYFARVAATSAEQAATFQNHYFIQSPVGWMQMSTIPLSDLEQAAGSAHDALRLAAPAAVLMTKVTDRNGLDTLSSLFRNTGYALIPGGYGDVMSTLDSAVSATGQKIISANALKVFDKEINHGRQNPFTTDLSIYRQWIVDQGGLKDEPRNHSVDELLRVAKKDLQAGRLVFPQYDCAFDKYKKVLNLADRQPEALEGLDKILSKYDKKLFNWQANPISAAKYCQQVREVLVFRWQVDGFTDRSNFRQWNSQFTNIDECLEPDIPEKLIEIGAYDECEQELNARVQSFEQISRMDWIGSVWGDPKNIRNKFGVLIAKMRLKILAGRQGEKGRKLPQKGKEFVDSVTGMKFVFVKGGCYRMGNNHGDDASGEKFVHQSCVDDFYIGKYEVTQEQYKMITGRNPSRFNGSNRPVEQVSWNDTQDYILQLNRRGSKKFRLPTEAEWEYAARSGGRNETYAGAEDADIVGWHGDNSGNRTHPVGQKQPNGWGLYDMSGNVWEWCSDWFEYNYYKNSPRWNPQGSSSGSDRVKRGGSFSGGLGNLRSTKRHGGRPGLYTEFIGFRLVYASQKRDPQKGKVSSSPKQNPVKPKNTKATVKDLYGTWKNKYVTYTFNNSSIAVRTSSDYLVSPYTVDRIDGNKIVLKFSNGKTRSFIIKEKNKVITDVGFFDDYDDCYRVNR